MFIHVDRAITVGKIKIIVYPKTKIVIIYTFMPLKICTQVLICVLVYACNLQTPFIVYYMGKKQPADFPTYLFFSQRIKKLIFFIFYFTITLNSFYA